MWCVSLIVCYHIVSMGVENTHMHVAFESSTVDAVGKCFFTELTF